MVTATFLKRIEKLESGPEIQEVKIFFYNAAETPCWTPEDPKEWQKLHPYRQAHIIVIEEVKGRELAEEPDETK